MINNTNAKPDPKAKGLWNLHDIQYYFSLDDMGQASRLARSPAFPPPVDLMIDGVGDLWRAKDVIGFCECLRWRDGTSGGRYAGQ